MYLGIYWNQPVCGCVCVSVCVQNTNFCQDAGGGMKSHLVTALIFFCQCKMCLKVVRISESVTLSHTAEFYFSNPKVYAQDQ